MAFSLKLEMPSDPQVLSVVRSAVHQFAAVVGFSEEECRSIILAVDEALANIIRHAYQDRHDQSIELTCRRIGPDSWPAVRPAAPVRDGLEFVLVDHGISVDPEKIKGRELEDVRPGGLGVHLILQIMDEVEYQPMPQCNQLRLVKLLCRSQSEGV